MSNNQAAANFKAIVTNVMQPATDAVWSDSFSFDATPGSVRRRNHGPETVRKNLATQGYRYTCTIEGASELHDLETLFTKGQNDWYADGWVAALTSIEGIEKDRFFTADSAPSISVGTVITQYDADGRVLTSVVGPMGFYHFPLSSVEIRCAK